MSRIDLTDRVTVGWDAPAGGAFWQEKATPKQIKAAENWLKANEDLEGSPEFDKKEALFNSGIAREGGMWPGIPLKLLRDEMPSDLRPLITDEVLKLLQEHAEKRVMRGPPIDLRTR